jgi:hypothetical protein
METVYGIVPAGMRPFYILLPVVVLLAGVIGLLALAGYGSQRARFILSDAGLDFRGDIYGRRVPWARVGSGRHGAAGLCGRLVSLE